MTLRSSRRRRILLVSLIAIGGPAAWGASVARQIATIYQPFRVERAALSPDGRHVAFATHESRGLEVRIFGVDDFALKSRTVLDDRAAAQVRFFEWAASGRLIVMTDRAQIAALDPAGRETALVNGVQALLPPKSDAPDRPATVRPYGFLADEPDILLLELTRLMPGGVEPATYIFPDVLGDPEPSEGAGGGAAFAASFEIQRPKLISGRPLPPERWLDLVRLNTRTGERVWSYRRRVDDAGGTLVADRSGGPRLVLEQGGVVRRFRLAPALGWRVATKNLDDEVTDRAAFVFNVSPKNFLSERSVPLGFDFDRELMYYASNIGRDTYGIYTFDFRTHGRTSFAIEEPGRDLVEGDRPWELPWTESPLVFDRVRRALVGVRYRALAAETRWLDGELGATQAVLNEKFPGRGVQLLGWSDTRERFLALISDEDDPGRYFVFNRRDGGCVEFLRRTVTLDPAEVNPAKSFAFDTPAGAHISGYLALPHLSPVAKPALVVWLHDGPWQRVAPGFNRDAQALAAMGFAVAHVNYRGSGGTGLRQREELRTNFDRAPLDDVLATLAWMQARHPFDAKRVAIAGEGFGGYLALRGLQLHPEVFRCGVIINGATDLDQYRHAADLAYKRERGPGGGRLPLQGLPGTPEEMKLPFDFDREVLRWFYGEGGFSLAKFSVAGQWETLKRPVFLLHDPRNPIAEVDEIRSLRDKLERGRRQVAYAEISWRFANGVPAERAPVMRKIGEYLNTTLYDFDVKIGDLTEKEGPR